MVDLRKLCQLRKGITKNRLEQPDGSTHGLYQIAQLEKFELGEASEQANLDASKARAHLLESGQVLVSLIGARTQAAVVTELKLPTVANSNLAILTPDIAQLDPYFLVSIIRTEEFQQQAQARITDSVLPHLSLDSLAQLKIPIPPISLQKEIASGFLALEAYQDLTQTFLRRQKEAFEAEVMKTLEIW